MDMNKKLNFLPSKWLSDKYLSIIAHRLVKSVWFIYFIYFNVQILKTFTHLNISAIIPEFHNRRVMADKKKNLPLTVEGDWGKPVFFLQIGHDRNVSFGVRNFKFNDSGKIVLCIILIVA